MQFWFDKSENEMQQLVNTTTIYSSKQSNTTKIFRGKRTAVCLQSGVENHGIRKIVDIGFQHSLMQRMTNIWYIVCLPFRKITSKFSPYNVVMEGKGGK